MIISFQFTHKFLYLEIWARLVEHKADVIVYLQELKKDT